MKTILTILLLISTPLSYGRYLPELDYSVLTTRADLIIIGAPTKVTLTEESEPVKFDDLPHPNATMAKVTKTEFSVQAILKGTPNGKIVLRHHRIPENVEYGSKDGAVFHFNGPRYLSFDPKKNTCYLMFLRRLPNGEYEAVAGQVDPVFSIKLLDSYPYARMAEAEPAGRSTGYQAR